MSPKSDPHRKLAFTYAEDQEAHRKDIKRGFEVLIKIPNTFTPITQHDHDNIYNIVLVVILMQNMMVEAHLESNEAESAEFYNTLSAIKTKSRNIGAILRGGSNYVVNRGTQVCF